MRNKFIAANWKMNCTANEAEKLLTEINLAVTNAALNNTHVVICLPSLYIQTFVKKLTTEKIIVGAQNCHTEKSGAYTGEISAEMIKSCGAKYCITGHSERRNLYNETNNIVMQKTKACLRAGLVPIVCLGEDIETREKNNYKEFIKTQFEAVYKNLNLSEAQQTIIAYEPIWAIGTGKTATPEQAQEVHLFIRQLIAENFHETLADEFIIIYGGSCNEKNAKELFNCADIDGGLIGSASLKADSFIQIIHAAE